MSVAEEVVAKERIMDKGLEDDVQETSLSQVQQSSSSCPTIWSPTTEIDTGDITNHGMALWKYLVEQRFLYHPGSMA